MSEINSYLEHLVSQSATELRFEPNQIPYITTANGQVNVSPTQILGGQISMLVFPMIPTDARQNLTRQDEVEFPYTTNLGNFKVRIKKSPLGLNVTINPTNGVMPDVVPTSSQVYRPIETLPDEELTPPSFNSSSFNSSSFSQPIEPQKNEEISSSASGVSENSSSLNYFLRKLKENNGVEVILTPNKEAVLVTDIERTRISAKPLFETQISLLIDPLITFETKKVLNETNKAEVAHSNQFGKFLIVLEKSGYDTSVRIKIVPEVTPTQTEVKPLEFEPSEESNYSIGSTAPETSKFSQPAPIQAETNSFPNAVPTAPTIAFNSNSKQQMDDFFRKMSDMGASDLHLSATMIPLVRKDGNILPLSKEFSAITPDKMKELLTSIMPEKNQEEFERRHDTDFAYEIKGLARFRANIFMDRKGPGGVFRVIPSEILTAEKLGLSKAILDLCNLSKGLVVVTGPTGSGKSTTLCAMVDHINKEREDHIITIEDPIEFVHDNKKCLINQREVHNHTDSFKDALRAALREDPDIVLVGEMRDLETIAIAIETAETGHLVFGTLHTSTAASTIDRIIDQFPADRQQQIRIMLSESLRGVIAQTLLPKKGGGRIAALEVLIVTPAISNLIREGKTFQIPSAMQTGKQLGMVMLNDALFELVQKGLVEPKDAHLKAVDKTGFEMILTRNGIKL
jgi:twitching motility protein PilT